MTVVLSTRDPDHAFHVADRGAMPHTGCMVRVGVPAEAVTRDSQREVYGVEIDVVDVPRPNGGACACRRWLSYQDNAGTQVAMQRPSMAHHWAAIKAS